MPINKEKKKEIWDTVKKAVSNAASVAFVNFHGLTVADAQGVRRGLKAQGVGYYVAKKTIVKKVLGETKVTGTLPELPGELAIAYSADLVAPAREVFFFGKKLEGKLSLLGGIFEGRFMNKEEMTVIASIPPLKTLHAQFVNVINSPIQGFVMALSEIGKKKV